MGISINIVQRMMERKLNFFGHICRMQDERLIKRVVLGIMDGKNTRGRPEKWNDKLVDWCSKDIGTLYRLAMNRTKLTFREVCHGHQRALSSWSKKRRERGEKFYDKTPVRLRITE